MGALKRMAAAFALALALGSGPALAAREADWRGHVEAAAARFGLPESWVLRVIAAKSGGRTHLAGMAIRSPSGAMGLMQIMPATWASLRARYRLGPDPHDPRDNIIAGTAYLREMYDRFGYPGLFAAYNAGPGRYGDYLARGRPLPRETRAYVARIVGAAELQPTAAGQQIRGHPDDAPSVDPIFLARGRPRGEARSPTPVPETREDAAIEAGPTQRAWERAEERAEESAEERAEESAAVAAPPENLLFLLRKPAPSGDR